MIKAYGFMYGDFVKVKPSGMVIKIAAIHHKKVAYHSTSSKLEYVRQDLLEPILLTEEILEKNGFKYDYDADECITDDGRSITIKGYTYKEEEKGILIDYFNGHIKATTFNIEVSKDINYIHELQHILHICNIEKQIKL